MRGFISTMLAEAQSRNSGRTKKYWKARNEIMLRLNLIAEQTANYTLIICTIFYATENIQASIFSTREHTEQETSHITVIKNDRQAK